MHKDDESQLPSVLGGEIGVLSNIINDEGLFKDYKPEEIPKCANLRVMVRCGSNNTVVSNAIVKINSFIISKKKVTNTNGDVFFQRIPPGTYEITAMKESSTTKVKKEILGDTKEITLSLCSCYRLKEPFLIAVTKPVREPKTSFDTVDPQLPFKNGKLPLGQDAMWSPSGNDLSCRIMPKINGISDKEEELIKSIENKNETELKKDVDRFVTGAIIPIIAMMVAIMPIIAMMGAIIPIINVQKNIELVKELFKEFLVKNDSIKVFEKPHLNEMINNHRNFNGFTERVLGASEQGKIRIHQVLKKFGWDINKVKEANELIDDLDTPAFDKIPGDIFSGLKVMIDGVGYIIVYVEDYIYDSCKKQYDIKLKFVLYDVFGLDDKDLNRFIRIFGFFVPEVASWWRLQHQCGYAPLLIRSEVHRYFKGVQAE